MRSVTTKWRFGRGSGNKATSAVPRRDHFGYGGLKSIWAVAKEQLLGHGGRKFHMVVPGEVHFGHDGQRITMAVPGEGRFGHRFLASGVCKADLRAEPAGGSVGKIDGRD